MFMIGAGTAMMYFRQPVYGKNDFTGYQKLDRGKKEDERLMNRYEKRKTDYTLIIYQTGCPDCHKVQRELCGEIKRKKLFGGATVVMDIAKLNEKELWEFKKKHRDLLVDGRWINSPTVAEMHGGSVVAKVTDGNADKMKKLLRKGR